MRQPKAKKITPEQYKAQQILWTKGILRWKLHKAQQAIYDKFYKCKEGKFVLCCSRRLGKSFLLCLLAAEHAIRIQDAEIKYAAPSQKQVKRILVPIFKQIFKDCPDDLKPNWHAQEQIYRFPNGSTIAIAGMDAGRADDLRGTNAHLALIDEAAFSNSAYVQEMVDSVLMPMTLLTRGKIVIASTPAKTPRHQFEKYYIEAKELGAAVHHTIYDNPMLTEKAIKDFCRQLGGENATAWKREALAEFVVDENLICIPEFTEAAQRSIVTSKYEKPKYLDYYTAMDVGLKDATGIVFGYWDFRNTRAVIEDEVLLHGVQEVRTDIIAEKVRLKEEQYYGKQKPYFRISDVDLLLINDLDKLHNLKFHPAKKKDSKEAGVNELRLLIKTGQLIIHPRCKHLIAQLESCIWDKNREKFERIDGLFHFDLVDALIYFIRGLRRNHNPYPAEWIDGSNNWINQQPSNQSPSSQTFGSIFKVKKWD